MKMPLGPRNHGGYNFATLKIDQFVMGKKKGSKKKGKGC